MNEDQMLCAWLVKRGYHVEPSGDSARLTQLGVMGPSVPITEQHLNMWVFKNAGLWPELVLLYERQGKELRPLRSLVKEWVIGL